MVGAESCKPAVAEEALTHAHRSECRERRYGVRWVKIAQSWPLSGTVATSMTHPRPSGD